MSTFTNFLVELANALESKTIVPDTHGACLIMIQDGNIPLLFEFDEYFVPNTVLLSCAITNIPNGYHADVFEMSLKGNKNIEDTLSVKPDEDMLYLHCRFHPGAHALNIRKKINVFLNTVKEWREKINALIQQPPHSEKISKHPSSIQVFPYKA